MEEEEEELAGGGRLIKAQCVSRRVTRGWGWGDGGGRGSGQCIVFNAPPLPDPPIPHSHSPPNKPGLKSVSHIYATYVCVYIYIYSYIGSIDALALFLSFRLEEHIGKYNTKIQ